MEKSQSASGREPELEPPTYSSLLNSQSQGYTPVQPETREPRSTDASIPRNTAASDSTSPSKTDNGRPMSRPGFDTPNPQIANISPVNETELTAIKKIPAPSRSAEAIGSGKTSRCVRTWALTLVILVAIAIGIGVGLYQRNQNREEEARLREFERKREIWQKEIEEVGRKAIQGISKLNFTFPNPYPIPDHRLIGL